jgi:hypothetical protein
MEEYTSSQRSAIGDMDCPNTSGKLDLTVESNRTVHTLGNGTTQSMMLDTHIPFGQIFPNSADVKAAIIAIAACVQDRNKSRHWASHLKLLTADIEQRVTRRNDDDLIPANIEHLAGPEDPEISAPGCSCIAHRSARLREDEKMLTLTDVDDLADCAHYVAVSYSCADMRDAVYTGPPFSIRTKDGSRPPRCPPALLQRVIEYTWDKGLRYFWIDQECIDQADADDLETGMQAMDIVYENSMDSVAILRTTITEQRHCDALGSLIAFDPHTAGPTHAADVLEILELITADVWFQRAWTLQESSSGGTGMTITLPCASGIEVPSELRHRMFIDPNEHVEFSLDHLVVSVASWFESGLPGSSENLSAEMALRLELWQDKWARLLPTGTLDFEADGLMNICLASEALWHMSIRENSVVADRLAIIANLCGYETRLDTMKLDKLGYGFSICVLVLAMLNGDTSILAGVGAYHRGKRGKLNSLYTDSRDRTPGHGTSWILPPRVCLDDVPAKERDSDGTLLELANADVLPNGSLDVEGCLWVVDDTFSLDEIRNSLLQTRTPLELAAAIAAGHSEGLEQTYSRLWTALLVEFSMRVLSHLSAAGYSNMVRLLWRELRPRWLRLSDSSPQEAHDYAEASFEEIVDVTSLSIKWPAPPCVELQSSLLKESIEPFAVLGSPAINYLLQKMMERQYIPVARPAMTSSGAKECAAIFEDATFGDQFFTPRVYTEPSLPLEPASSLSTPLKGYRWYPLCWRVTDENADISESGDTSRLLLRCHGLHCGAWLADEQNLCEVEFV